MAGSAGEVSWSRRLDVAGRSSSSLSRRNIGTSADRRSRVVGSWAGGVNGVGGLGWESDGDDDRLRASGGLLDGDLGGLLGRIDDGDNRLGGLLVDRLAGLGARGVLRVLVLGADGSGDGDLDGADDGAGSGALLDVGTAAGDGDEAGAVDGLGDIWDRGAGLRSISRGGAHTVNGSRAGGDAIGGRSVGWGRRSSRGRRFDLSIGRGSVDRGGRGNRGGAGLLSVDGRRSIVGDSSSDAGDGSNGNGGTHLECSGKKLELDKVEEVVVGGRWVLGN